MQSELLKKEVLLKFHSGSTIRGTVTDENHVFIFLKVVRDINNGTMTSEEVIPRINISSCKIIN